MKTWIFALFFSFLVSRASAGDPPAATQHFLRRWANYVAQSLDVSRMITPFISGIRSFCPRLSVESDESEMKDYGLTLGKANLASYPEQISHLKSADELVFGDLHGNTMKLIHILIREGTMELDPDRAVSVKLYQELAAIYLKGPLRRGGLDFAALTRFKEIIKNAKINKNGPRFKFLGDELGDRGTNDFFTLLVIDKMHQSEVPFNFILSNHTQRFLDFFETEVMRGNAVPKPSEWRSMASMFNLQAMLRYPGTEELKTELVKLVKTSYLPHLKAVSYTLDSNNRLFLQTHAPVGLEGILKVARQFRVDCGLLSVLRESRESLTRCIDAINLKFDQLKVTESITRKFRLNSEVQTGLTYIAYNRYQFQHRLKKPRTLTDGTDLWFVHGHDGNRTYMDSGTVNMDNTLGIMGLGKGVGEYARLHLGTEPAPEPVFPNDADAKAL
jgi:hypothetical protein